jgi:dihydroorotase
LDTALVKGRNICILPGLADVHVHLREPGFSYKETIASGTAAAARGGYTTVCPMPNLNPVPDSLAHLQQELALIKRDARVQTVPYGAITVGQQGEKLADMAAMAPYVCAFSDDGKGVQDEGQMRKAMETAKTLKKLIVAHCEDNSLLHGGYIHDGDYAKAHGHRGICSESEWGPIARDARLAEEVGCGYHVCHVSTAESVEVIRKAKARGVDITCETAPHYLVLNDSQLQEDGRFKMNPPIRSERDRQALLEGILDGTIDMIATDHAPHSAEEKSLGLEKSLMGVVGLETAFPALYTELVEPGQLSLEKLVALLCLNPRKRFHLPVGEDFTVFDLDAAYVIDPADFVSLGRATPFAGRTVHGKCLLTVCDGRVAWQDPEL